MAKSEQIQADTLEEKMILVAMIILVENVADLTTLILEHLVLNIEQRI